MIRILVLAAAMLPTMALGAECTLANAHYSNETMGLSLRFRPLPDVVMGNQTLAFDLVLDKAKVTIAGSVYRPNGFGAPLWSIEGPCDSGSAETCGFVEGEPTGVYANYDGEVRWIRDEEPEVPAPRQIILPSLAVSLWYSSYRNTAFVDDVDAGDVFTLTGCE